MEPHEDQKLSIEKTPDPASLDTHQRTPRKRFRIEKIEHRIVKLEERIAPSGSSGSMTRSGGFY